jgi:hypothetical protein
MSTSEFDELADEWICEGCGKPMDCCSDGKGGSHYVCLTEGCGEESPDY